MNTAIGLISLLCVTVTAKPTTLNPHGYYGPYNPCKYEIWPWPTEVECAVDGITRYLSPTNFQISLKSQSESKNSSILLSALSRYQQLIFNQPQRITRGYLVEPQFILDNDGYDDDDDTSRVRGKSQSYITGIEVMVLEEHDGTPKNAESDESYKINIDAQSSLVYIESVSVWGAIYALETFSQLVEHGDKVRNVPVTITDTPRFPWRGFLLDTSNHFIPVSAITRLIDSMAATKLNVLHWHLVDSYAFPFLSQRYPDLAKSGSWLAGERGMELPPDTYTTDDIRYVVEYCKYRGIRIVPEMDVPGHGYSWGLSEKFQEITTACPHYVDELGHIDDVPLDPTVELTYDTIRGLFTELAVLFPDQFFHIGGDEVKYGCWNESQSIIEWMKEHNFSDGDFYSLEQYFFKRVGEFCTKALGHSLVAWEEVFFDDSGGTDGAHGAWIGSDALPPSSTVVEIWTGPDYLEAARDNGYDAILAYGWYLDRQNPVDGEDAWFFGDTWAQMYGVDPEMHTPKSEVDPQYLEKKRGRALGGEVSMWTEQVDENNIDSQVWPRAAAAAERLWSNREIKSAAAAAPRLSSFRCRLISRYSVRAGPIWSDYCVVDASGST
mmetsp:Transcript_23820/g.34929  ORF Transcript_23820/g.34929 Transcript_23820/m.34929 type:complete len:608 (+) Transcript_23820:49-1872(+)